MTQPTDPPTIVVIDGEPRSSCHHSTLEVQREVGPDIAIYSAEEFYPPDPDDRYPQARLMVHFQKTYDGDGGSFMVTCGGCGVAVDADLEVEEL